MPVKSFTQYISETAKAPDLQTIANEILSSFKAVDRVDSSDIQIHKNGDKSIDVMIRYWGKWEMPPGEEDDGDYDWEVLSDESGKKADTIVKAAQAKHADLKIYWTTSEKNWLEIQISKK